VEDEGNGPPLPQGWVRESGGPRRCPSGDWDRAFLPDPRSHYIERG
jgi:hypothetical protein